MRTILLIEDDGLLRETTTDLFERLGFKVHQAGTGDEALLLLNSGHRFTHIFTDVILPGPVNGFDLATFAIHLRPQPKVVLASGTPAWTLPQLPEGTVLISKPYNSEELMRHLAP